ncbi:ketopantoate reductase family protein [Humibacter albus]|uniref:ketopantoate reductase family protein n=1 Tax=Humibacter albus TaxID=427754 RepID=UPI0003B7639F|nr:2-dehydropantoate 2-reductase N-terminal domain-containing protein [Humibacter albus]
MRVVVVGGGVIGSIYAAQLAAAGEDVGVLARGRRLTELASNGLRVRSGERVLMPRVDLLPPSAALPETDLVIVTVRAGQLRAVLELLEAAPDATVLFLQHLGGEASEVVDRVGAERAVRAFPGVGGLIHDDGTVEYVGIAAQPTTIDAGAPRGALVRRLLASTGLPTVMERDMAGWYATHEVLIACMGAGILSCGGDAAALAGNASRLRSVASAVREGFGALQAHGVGVTPSALRILFSWTPRWFATAYWRRALRGPVGTIALAPHFRASEHDEFRLLCANVIQRMGTSSAPTLRGLLSPYARSVAPT